MKDHILKFGFYCISFIIGLITGTLWGQSYGLAAITLFLGYFIGIISKDLIWKHYFKTITRQIIDEL